MKEYLAYIDETGDPDFNSSASEYFFIGAVIVEKDQYDKLSEKLLSIKSKYGISEFKSASSIKIKTRYEIFYDLIELDFKTISIWVDKKNLSGNWYRFRDKFYKYIQRRLNHEIHRLFENIQVHIDKFGSRKYQDSFEKYLVKSLQEELFDPQIEISSHKYEMFIQVADFISGSINWLLKNDNEGTQQLWNIIQPKWITRLTLPNNNKYLDPSFFEHTDNYFDICLKEADRYLQKNINNEESPKYKTLEYLYYSSLEAPEAFIYTAEILNWLEQINMKLSEEQFRNEVMASLRDEGLIIVGTRKGLKIPTRNEDLIEYISFSTNLALPILRRLKRALTFVDAKMEGNNYMSSLSNEMRRILNNVNA